MAAPRPLLRDCACARIGVLGEGEAGNRRLLAAAKEYIYSAASEGGALVRISPCPGCEAVTGYAPAEFAGEPSLWERIVHPADHRIVRLCVAGVLKGEAAGPLQHRILHKHSGIRLVRHLLMPRRDQQGRVSGWDGLVSDVTETTRAEQLLEVQYAVTRELAEAFGLNAALLRILACICETFRCFFWDVAAFWTFDADSGLLHCDGVWHAPSDQLARFAEVTRGFTFAAGVGLPGRIWASGQPCWIPDVADASNSPRAPFAERAGLHGACAFPIRSDQALLGVIELFSREVQQRDPHMLAVLGAVGVQVGQFIAFKQAQEQRRLSDARLQDILDHSPAVIHLKDLEGRYLLINRRFEELFHVRRDKVVGKTPQDVFPQPIASALRHNDQKVLAARGPLEFEEALPTNGELHTFLSVKFPLFDAQGSPYAVCGILTDITDRKRAEGQLQRAYAELAQNEAALKHALRELQASSEELKTAHWELMRAAQLETAGALAAGVAHEVKNPLQTILMGVDYLERSLPGPNGEFARVLVDMRDAVRRADAIVRELLQLSKPREFALKAENLNVLLDRALWLVHSDVVACKVTLVREFGPDVPPVRLDRGKMEQVFINLFINALQAMPKGGALTISTRAVRFTPDLIPGDSGARQFNPGEPVVVVQVLDSGTGIPEANLPKIFDPFFTTKPAGVGAGLGLAVVKQIVELHGGNIDIRNAPSRGVRVTLVLKGEADANGQKTHPGSG